MINWVQLELAVYPAAVPSQQHNVREVVAAMLERNVAVTDVQRIPLLVAQTINALTGQNAVEKVVISQI